MISFGFRKMLASSVLAWAVEQFVGNCWVCVAGWNGLIFQNALLCFMPANICAHSSYSSKIIMFVGAWLVALYRIGWSGMVVGLCAAIHNSSSIVCQLNLNLLNPQRSPPVSLLVFSRLG